MGGTTKTSKTGLSGSSKSTRQCQSQSVSGGELVLTDFLKQHNLLLRTEDPLIQNISIHWERDLIKHQTDAYLKSLSRGKFVAVMWDQYMKSLSYPYRQFQSKAPNDLNFVCDIAEVVAVHRGKSVTAAGIEVKEVDLRMLFDGTLLKNVNIKTGAVLTCSGR